jgi:hypothetical protein
MSTLSRGLSLLILAVGLSTVAAAHPHRDNPVCDMGKLLSEKQAVVSELRSALYCKVCKKTKTEIEKQGENFSTHLGKNEMRKADKPAPPEMVERVSQRFDELVKRLCGGKGAGSASAQEGPSCEDLRAYRDGKLLGDWDKAVQKYRLHKQAQDDLLKIRRELLDDTTWHRSDWSAATGIIAANLRATSRLISNLLAFAPGAGPAEGAVDTGRLTAERVAEKLRKGEKIDALAVAELARQARQDYKDAITRSRFKQAKRTVEQLAADVKAMVYLKPQQDALKATVREQLNLIDSEITKYEAHIQNARRSMEAIEAIKQGIDQYCIEKSRSPGPPARLP